MDVSGKWRIYFSILSQVMVLSGVSSHQRSSPRVNLSTEEATAGKAAWPRPWDRSSDAGGSQPDDRWRPPKTSPSAVYSFKVTEDTPPGTVVGRVETTSQTPTPSTFSVLEDDGESLFLLSPVSGEFLLSRSLDFETQGFYVLTVQVQHSESWVSSVRVYFNVLDVNDNPPVFSQDVFTASLLEDTPVGTCFLSINVSDKDDGANGELNVKIVSGDNEDTFVLHSFRNLCLHRELDREHRSSYSLTIMATDCVQPASSQFTTTALVTINVEDINDNAPVFKSAPSVSIPEDTPLHSVIMTVHAEDDDSGPNGSVSYDLINTWDGTFRMDSSSGEVSLEKVLDREEVDSLFVTVTAADGGAAPRMATTVNVTVTVEDVNDHHPEIPQSSYSLEIMEDVPRGTSLLRIQARDPDAGSNGIVRYELTQIGPFVVDSVRGVVTVMDELDRERESNYTLFIIAADQGNTPRSATANITVTVLDVNDVAPRFNPETLIVRVMENEDDRGSMSYQVSASDEDSGMNSQIVYHVRTGNNDGLFSLSANGTLDVLERLDRENCPLHILTITAVDSGLPSLTGTLTVHVVVDDVNDNRPEFTEEAYHTIVSEDSAIGTVFAMITASDPDEGVSGEIRYFMENTDVPFAIEETSGELYTTGILNRERDAIYRVTVIGSDSHPTEALSSSVLVIVLISDINDHWPQFLNSPYVAYVPTDLMTGSVVYAVQATDGDTDMNAELHYSLYGPSSDRFSIDPLSGTIFTSSDALGNDDTTVHVHVEDAGEIPKFDIATVSIRFENSSDFPGLNVEILHFSLPEDEPPGTLVAVISAVSSRAEPVSFYIASGNFEDVFVVEQTSGAVILEKALDHEHRKAFPLLVEARDAGSPPFSSFAEVHVNVSDVNDNAPQFTQKEYQCEVFENSAASVFCDVLAVDADSNIYSTVVYRIVEENWENLFSIDTETGLLSTTGSLDREHVAEFNLTVEAAELENLQHKDTATIIVTVLDRNDNPPRFTHVFYIEVPEDVPPGYVIMQVASSDDDTDANALTRYSIVDQNEDFPFYVDFTSGFITVVFPLDREESDQYVFKVMVNDSAWSVSTDVTIIVLDVNDNKPEFSQDFYIVVLPETTQEEVSVVEVIATDTDVGKNAEIFYLLDFSNEDFWVNSSTGEIFTKQPLKLFDIYEFTVFAFDRSRAPLSSNATVIVRSEPRNLYPPLFSPVQRRLAVPDHLAVGTELIQLSAFDPDLNSSADVQYVLKGGNSSTFVWIQPENGKLYLNRTLTGRANLFLLAFIEARDQGFPSLTSQIELVLDVTGRNRFAPSFSKSRVSFSVPEDLPVGSVIGKIQAVDGDYGANGAITYQVSSDNQSLAFSVGKASGLLTLVKDLDFESENVLHFHVKAMDGGWFSKTSILNVTVLVQDVNDNPPLFSDSEYVASVLENAEIGSVVADVRAFDNDSGVNAQIFYSLFSGHEEEFKVDPSNGTVTSLEVFDYEREQMFDLTIKASNPGGYTLFSLAHVVIRIIDVNEFTPTFRNKELHFSVFKNVTVGTLIGKVKATDNDLGREGLVFYLMFGANKNKGFEIEQLSGEIYTTGSLRKLGNSEVILRVLAKNAGVITEGNTDEALVHISVINTNDAPIFSSIRYLANITEDSPAGTSVVSVSALDQDPLSDWSRVFFNIASGNTDLTFTIDASTGVVSLNSTLDRELCSMYHLTITATDSDFPPATGTADVIVTILDVNDNAPVLTSTVAEVKENQPEGFIAVRLNASDADWPPNQGPFTFWLLNSSETDSFGAFSLTPDGVLFTTRVLDREQLSTYSILVGVKDSGLPSPQTSTTTLHIKVVDENDNPPSQRTIFIEVKYFGVSFQGGWIGNVNPEDPDESDTFTCSIRSGPVNMFSLQNGTCELWSAPFQGEATLNITVEASDQLHLPVNNSIYVSYKGFTNASIDSSVLFYVASTSMEEFLSRKYLRFVKALDSLFNLQASKTHVFGIKKSGVEILLLAAVRNYNGEYINREIASGISAGHKKLLEKQSNVSISYITSDPCLASPCQNRATCNQNIYVSQEVSVLESASVIFVSPQKEVFNCMCTEGFTGFLCEDDIDECQTSPCKNEGTCVNTEGSFFCRCQEGFPGVICSADEDECLKVNCQNGGSCVATREGYQCNCVPGFEGRRCEKVKDHCGSSPCAEGSCSSSPTGFSCNCSFGISGTQCEEPSYGFEELSFMEFPPLDHWTNIISLEFATVQKNSLLLYNPGGASSSEFLALEILDGAVQLSYDLGAGSVRLRTQKKVADGHFHSVTVRRIGNIGYLHVDNCTEVDKKGFCSTRMDGLISKRTLDVGSSNMTFGGVRSIKSLLLHPAQISAHDFVGCARNVRVNGMKLKPSTALAAFNIIDRCPRGTARPCEGVPCGNNGVCYDLWSDYFCECKIPFTGRNCTEEMSEELVLWFNGSDYIEYSIKEGIKRDYMMKESMNAEKNGSGDAETVLSIRFKTKDDGVLVFVHQQMDDITLKIKNKKPVYISEDPMSGHLLELTADVTVADGVWHVLSLVTNGQHCILSVDGSHVFNSTVTHVGLSPAKVEKVILGAAPVGVRKHPEIGFRGCVQGFSLHGYTLPVSGPSLMVDVWPSSTFFQSSCSSEGVCFGLSLLPDRSCICLHNVSSSDCDVCVSAAEDKDVCLEVQDGGPLWVTAVVLPVISILVFVGVFLWLLYMGRGGSRRRDSSLMQKGEHEINNRAYCLESTEGAGRIRGDDLVSADRQKSAVQSCCHTGQRSNVQPELKSELEYDDISSFFTALHSDLLKAGSTKWVKAKPKQFGGSQMPDVSSENTNTTRPQRDLTHHRPLLLQTKHARSVVSELSAPTQAPSWGDNQRLNRPLQKPSTVSITQIPNVSPATETGHTHPGSDAKQHHVSVVSGSAHVHGKSPVVVCECGSPTAACQGTSEGAFEKWEPLLNLCLPYSCYAPVFDDIACLPAAPTHSYDLHDDYEEVI